MNVELERPQSLAETDLASWRRLQSSRAELSRAFLCPEFVLAAAAARGDVWVASIEDDGRLVGFFPFQRRGGDEGLPVGFGISSVQGAVTDPGAPFDPRELIGACGLDSWYFDHLVPSISFEPHYSGLRNACFVDVAHGYDAYARERREAGSRQIAELERKARKLEREVGPVEFTLHSDEPELLRLLMQWKSEQFRRTGFVDRFRIPWVVETVERVHATQAAHFAGTLSVLSADGKPIAMNMGMRSHTALEIWFPTYDSDFASYSPGLILLLKLAQSAPQAGLTTLELGRSGAPYKERLMNGERPQAAGRVSLSARPARRHSPERLLRAIPGARVGRVLDRLEERRRWRSLDPRAGDR